MRDLLYVVITLAFFAVCVGLVRACDLLLGPDEESLDEGSIDGVSLDEQPVVEAGVRS